MSPDYSTNASVGWSFFIFDKKYFDIYTVQIHAIVNPHHTKKLSINYAYLYLYVGTYADLGVEIQKHAL